MTIEGMDRRMETHIETSVCFLELNKVHEAETMEDTCN